MVDLYVQQIIVVRGVRLGFFKASWFALLWGNKCFVSGCVWNFLKALLIVTLIQVCWSTSWCRVIRRQRAFCISMRRCTIVWCMGEAHAWGLGHPINWGVCRQRIISCISDNSCLATNISKCTARESIYRLCFIPQGGDPFVPLIFCCFITCRTFDRPNIKNQRLFDVIQKIIFPILQDSSETKIAVRVALWAHPPPFTLRTNHKNHNFGRRLLWRTSESAHALRNWNSSWVGTYLLWMSKLKLGTIKCAVIRSTVGGEIISVFDSLLENPCSWEELGNQWPIPVSNHDMVHVDESG